MVFVKYLRSEKRFQPKCLLQVAALETCQIISGTHRRTQVCFQIQAPSIFYQVRQLSSKDQSQITAHPTWNCKETEEGRPGVDSKEPCQANKTQGFHHVFLCISLNEFLHCAEGGYRLVFLRNPQNSLSWYRGNLVSTYPMDQTNCPPLPCLLLSLWPMWSLGLSCESWAGAAQLQQRPGENLQDGAKPRPSPGITGYQRIIEL